MLPALLPLIEGVIGRIAASEAAAALGSRASAALGGVARGGAGAAAEGAAGAVKPPPLPRTNFSDPNLFKRAFTEAGMQTPEAINQSQQRDAAEEKQSQARKELLAKEIELLKSGTKGLLGFTIALVGVPKVVLSFSRAMVESQEHLARFSSTIAGAITKLERGRIGRDIETAQSTGFTTSLLASSLNGLEQELAPLKNALTNLTNVVGTVAIAGVRAGVIAAKVATGVIWLERIHGLVKRFFPWIRQPAQQPARDWLSDIKAGKFSGQRNPPPPEPDRRRRGGG